MDSSTDIISSDNDAIRTGINFSLNWNCAMAREYSVGRSSEGYIVIPKDTCGIYTNLSKDLTLDTGYHMYTGGA